VAKKREPPAVLREQDGRAGDAVVPVAQGRPRDLEVIPRLPAALA
jgi:hypothetical protein